MAKIVRYHENGGPEVLRVEEGLAGAPGPGEVLLGIEAVGLNRAELAQRGGHYILKPPLPARLGSEAAGTILAIGPDVTEWRVGERVSTLPPGRPGDYGAYGSETLWPAGSLMAIHPDLDMVEAASSWVAFFTAWGGLVDAGALKVGDFLVITAASSSVGLAALQVAADVGAIPIATTRNGDKAAALIAAGAAHVIATDEGNLISEVQRITGGAGARLIFDPVAGSFAETLFECLSDHGTLMIYGGLSNEPMTFPRHLAIRRNLNVRGFNFFGFAADPSWRGRVGEEVLQRLQDQRFSMPIAARFSLDRVGDAHRAMERNEHVGKIILTVS